MAVNEPPGELMYMMMSRSGSLRLEHQQLRHDIIGRRVVDLDAEEDHAVLEQLVVRVLTLVAVGRALLELREVSRLEGIAMPCGSPAGGDVHVSVSSGQFSVPPPPMTSEADSRMWSTKP